MKYTVELSALTIELRQVEIEADSLEAAQQYAEENKQDLWNDYPEELGEIFYRNDECEVEVDNVEEI